MGPKSAIRQLGLGNNLIQESVAGAFSAAVKAALDSKAKLQTLELQYNLLDSDALRMLVVAIQSNRPDQLNTLNLRNNSVGGKVHRLSARKGGKCWKPSGDGVAQLAALLESLGKKAGRPKGRETALDKTGEKQPHSHGLSVLDLQSNRIHPQHMAPLLAALRISALIHLELSGNAFGTGLTSQAYGTSRGKSMVQTLDTKGETAGAHCEEVLASALGKNEWLRSLGLRACDISDKAAASVAAAVDPRVHDGSGLRLLDLRSNLLDIQGGAARSTLLGTGNVVVSPRMPADDEIITGNSVAHVNKASSGAGGWGGGELVNQKRLVLL
jgi:Ran GTPase-activating protein (RanGAP) involved in mRNA processing and transport